MRNWRSVQLKDAGVWLSGGTPFTDNPRYWDGDIPWISAASLKGFRISRSDRCITELGAVSGTRLVPPGTVLFVVRGMSLKTEFRVGVTERQVAFGQDCKAIIPAPGVDAKFLARALKARSRDILTMVDEAGHGTGRLPTDLIAKLAINIPELPEQRQITEILDSADEDVRYYEAVIVKLKLKASGLLHDLLDRVEASEQPLAAFLSMRPRNGFSPNEVDSWTGTVALGLGCLTPDGFVPRQIKPVPAGDPRYAGAWLSDGDLLISRSNTLDLVGLVGRYRYVGAPCVYPDLMMRLVPNSFARPEFLELVLRDVSARQQIKRMSQGTSGSMVKLSSGSVMRLTVNIPDLKQQDRVLSIYEADMAVLRAEERKIAKLRLLKQGLMENLLTGRVRLTVLYLDVEFAVGSDAVGRGEEFVEGVVELLWGAEGPAVGAHPIPGSSSCFPLQDRGRQQFAPHRLDVRPESARLLSVSITPTRPPVLLEMSGPACIVENATCCQMGSSSE
jgi:type I restriction enzyme S subunit